MKILHVSVYHLCLARAGTEVYIDSLAKELEKKGAENFFLIINSQKTICHYDNVLLLNPNLESNLQSRIWSLMEDYSPQLVCIHTSDGPEVFATQFAKNFNIPVFYFFHTKSWLCYQRNMMYAGKIPCRKILHPLRCAVCLCCLNSTHVYLGWIKAIGGWFVKSLLLGKDSWYKTARMELHGKETILKNSSKIIVFTEKDYKLFEANNISKYKLEIIPQGLTRECLDICRVNALKNRQGVLQIGYIGRCFWVKGCDILVNAALKLPYNIEFQLHIYGYKSESEYCVALKQRASVDSRIIFHDAMTYDEVMLEYAKLDVLCIPSVIQETGPLTLLEGAYSGCIVAGSSLLGQIDFLKEYGRVIEPNTSDAWLAFFQECVSNLENIRLGKRTVFPKYRTLHEIAGKILQKACDYKK